MQDFYSLDKALKNETMQKVYLKFRMPVQKYVIDRNKVSPEPLLVEDVCHQVFWYLSRRTDKLKKLCEKRLKAEVIMAVDSCFDDAAANTQQEYRELIHFQAVTDDATLLNLITSEAFSEYVRTVLHNNHVISKIMIRKLTNRYTDKEIFYEFMLNNKTNLSLEVINAYIRLSNKILLRLAQNMAEFSEPELPDA